MDKPIAEFKLNNLPLIIIIIALIVPIIIFFRLIEYDLLLAISISIIVSLYEYYVIKSEKNFPFKIYTERFEGKLNGKLYKVNVSDIDSIIKKDGFIVFHGANLNPLMKVKSKPKNDEFYIFIKNTFPDKFFS